MATVIRFEQLEAWQQARILVHEVYTSSDSGPLARDFVLRDQIRRSALSTMSNIAEGFAREGNREFAQFLSVAKGSCAEVQSQLYVAMDAGYLPEARVNEILQQAERTARIIGGLIRHLRTSKHRGPKFD